MQSCVHRSGSRPSSPPVEASSNFSSRPFDVNTCSFSSNFSADNPSDSDATGRFMSSSVLHTSSGPSLSDCNSFSDLEVATQPSKFYLGDIAGSSNQDRYGLEAGDVEQVSLPKRRGTLNEAFGLEASAEPRRVMEHSTDQSNWRFMPRSHSTAVNLTEGPRKERASSTESNGEGCLWKDYPASSGSTNDSRKHGQALQRGRSSSSPIAQSPSTPDTPNTMKFCSVGKSLIDAFDTPRQKQEREFPIQAKPKPKPKQPMEISESEGSTDDSRHTLFSLVPGVNIEPNRSLDSVMRLRPSKRHGQGLADFFQLSDQAGSPGPAPSSGYGTQQYLQNTD